MSEPKRKRIISQEFRRKAVERILAGENITAMARELGVLRKSLYEWKDKYHPRGLGGVPQWPKRPLPITGTGRKPEPNPGTELIKARERIAELERKVGKQELELDFFGAALQRIAAMKARSKEKPSVNSLPSDPGKAD